jgi:hypothetical protein
LQRQRDEIFENMEREIIKLYEPHMDYIRMIERGETPFRNSLHMIAVMLSDCIDLKFTPEEEALRKTVHEILKLK